MTTCPNGCHEGPIVPPQARRSRESFLVLFFKKEQERFFFLKKEAKTFYSFGLGKAATAVT